MISWPHINTNLSDRLVLNIWPYPKSFMTLVWMKNYIYMVIDDGKVPYGSSFIPPYLIEYMM